MKKLETIEQACRALAELHPEKFRYREHGDGFNSPFAGLRISGICGEIVISGMCACDFDTILALEGLEIEIYKRGNHKYGYGVMKLNGNSYWGVSVILLETKKLASEAAFFAAVELLVKE